MYGYATIKGQAQCSIYTMGAAAHTNYHPLGYGIYTLTGDAQYKSHIRLSYRFFRSLKRRPWHISPHFYALPKRGEV